MAVNLDAAGVIDSYVHDVARRLPAARRDDVAYELRALLADDLRERAADAGREPDAGQALAMLREFGRPSETAARYHRPFTLIEPSDTWSFVVAAIAGGTVLGFAGSGDVDTAADAGVLTLAWFGLLLLGFVAKNLVRRRDPDAFAWRPRKVRDLDTLHVPGTLVTAAGLVVATAVYAAPGRVLDAVTGGRIDAASLAYTDDFAGPWRRPWLVGLLAIIVAAFVVALVQRRWRQSTRVVRTLFLICAGIQLGWHVNYGYVFADPELDAAVLPVAGGVAAVAVLVGLWQLYREHTAVRPAPSPSGTALGEAQIQP